MIESQQISATTGTATPSSAPSAAAVMTSSTSWQLQRVCFGLPVVAGQDTITVSDTNAEPPTTTTLYRLQNRPLMHDDNDTITVSGTPTPLPPAAAPTPSFSQLSGTTHSDKAAAERNSNCKSSAPSTPTPYHPDFLLARWRHPRYSDLLKNATST